MIVLCPVCRSQDTHLFLQREKTPVHQNLLMDSYAQAVAIDQAKLAMKICGACGFVFNAAFEPDKLQYGPDYDNRQDCSTQFRSHLDAMTSLVLEQHNIKNAHIVEVGCGQGDFLSRLIQKRSDISGTGFDPSYIGPAQQLNGRLKFVRKYYDQNCAETKADIVVSRHVIEHVQFPLEMLLQVRHALADNIQVKVFFETPCVEWILNNRVIWDFFYEHCSLFSKASLQTAFELSGFEVERCTHVFNGQYLWLEARPSDRQQSTDAKGDELLALASAYTDVDRDLIENWKQFIQQLRVDGKVAIWGAAAKGTTFLNLIDPERELIDYVVDINSNKQGRFIAGTGHSIIAYHDLELLGVRNILLMNPNYLHENKALLQQAGLDIHIHTGCTR